MKTTILIAVVSATMLTSCSVGTVGNVGFRSTAERRSVLRREKPIEPDTSFLFDTTISEAQELELVELQQNSPNPFNATTVISYSLRDHSSVNATIYNILGKRVRSFPQSTQDSGRYNIEWDGTDGKGQTLASGVYIFVLTLDDISTSRKLVMLK